PAGIGFLRESADRTPARKPARRGRYPERRPPSLAQSCPSDCTQKNFYSARIGVILSFRSVMDPLGPQPPTSDRILKSPPPRRRRTIRHRVHPPAYASLN